MEVDEIQRQVCKFQRVSSNGSTISDNSSKIATHLDNSHEEGGGAGGGVGRLCGWPSSRIVRVSRASGGKDRHSKVLTSKGLRDRRVRLSVGTAIQFYDLQDRLGYDQPSKAVEWLLKAAAASIDELPSLDPSFQQQLSQERKSKSTGNEDPQNQNSKSSACSSTSETSKGSGLSLSRSENRIKARERAREMASMKEKEKEKEIDSSARFSVLNGISQNSSFTDLLTGGIAVARTTPMDYFFGRPPPPQCSPQIIQMPHFNVTAGDSHHHQQQQQQFSFLQENYPPVVTAGGGGGGGGGESYNLNFSMASSSGGGVAPGFNRGTLQSNLPSSLMAHHHHHLQRFQSSPMDGSASTNLPFFIMPNAMPDHFLAAGAYDGQRLQLCYGSGGGGGQSDQHKDKSKN